MRQVALLAVRTLDRIARGVVWLLRGGRRRRRLRRGTRERHAANLRTARRKLDAWDTRPPEPARLFGELRRLNPFVFEELLLLCFARHGFRAERNRAYTGDGGIDGAVRTPDGRRFVLQAKRYRGCIKAEHIRDFAQAVERHRAHGGLFVHCGRTGGTARETLRRLPTVRLVSGNGLVGLVLGHRGALEELERL